MTGQQKQQTTPQPEILKTGSNCWLFIWVEGESTQVWLEKVDNELVISSTIDLEDEDNRYKSDFILENIPDLVASM